MKPYYTEPGVDLYQSDARTIPLPDASVQCCVTSPPYWGLRDYGVTPSVWSGDSACEHYFSERVDYAQRLNDYSFRHDGLCRKCGAWRGCFGLEPTPATYVEHTVEIFREVRRVLKPDGVLWLNLGSSYLSAGGERTYGSYDGATGRGPGTRRNRASDGNGPSQFPSGSRAPSCGTDGKELQGSTASGSACSDLCDGCLVDFLNHRARTVGTDRLTEQSAQQLSQTVRGSEPSGFGSTLPGASPLDAPASSTLESWRRHRGACSRCDSRASFLLGLHSSSGDVPAFGRMTWLDYTTKLKQKDMVPIPWMVAMALQADGWYLRADIIWAKPNPMPESVTDRPTKSHEYLFLLSKSERYYFDADAISEPCESGPSDVRKMLEGQERIGGKHKDLIDPLSKASSATNIGRKRSVGGTPKAVARETGEGYYRPNGVSGSRGVGPVTLFRNARSVWTVATAPYPGAHFATFPPTLPERCILAGSRPGDLVLDPFNGSGTTGEVARKWGRRYVGVDLNPEYLELTKRRLAQGVLFGAGSEVA